MGSNYEHKLSTTSTLLTAMGYIKHTHYLSTFGKSFSRQAVWVLYIRELLHFKAFYKENKRYL